MNVRTMDPTAGPVLTKVTFEVDDYQGNEEPEVVWSIVPVNLVSFDLVGGGAIIVIQMPEALEPIATHPFTIFAGEDGPSCSSPPFTLKED